MKTLVNNIYNSPSAVTFGKGDQVAVANVAAYNAPFNITAALGNNTVTLSFLRIQHSDDKYAYSGVTPFRKSTRISLSIWLPITFL